MLALFNLITMQHRVVSSASHVIGRSWKTHQNQRKDFVLKELEQINLRSQATTKRFHFQYASPGTFHDHQHDHTHPNGNKRDFNQRGFTVGIGGPVGSGKTALILHLLNHLIPNVTSERDLRIGVVTNDIFTQEDTEFLQREQTVLPKEYIIPVETGGCPHAAIREDVSANLSALEFLTRKIANEGTDGSKTLLFCESGGDNLAANFSRELADLTLYVIDVAGGEKVPRKGGPGITQSDLLIINKKDLAEAVGADLNVMKRDADRMRRLRTSDYGESESGPVIFAAIKHDDGVPEIADFILDRFEKATN